MKVILGSYRGPGLVRRAIDSLAENAIGVTSLVVVDDGDNPDWSAEIRSMHFVPADRKHAGTLPRPIVPQVIEMKKRGYNQAMRQVVRLAGRERFLFWEEDFTLDVPVDLTWMEMILMQRPYLAQLALLRGPHFPNEHAEGGLLPALEKRLGKDFVQLKLVKGIWEQRGTFTCNPAVWQANVANQGWPLGKWSEDRMRDKLLGLGYRFGFVPGQRVTHDGERSGFGY